MHGFVSQSRIEPRVPVVTATSCVHVLWPFSGNKGLGESTETNLATELAMIWGPPHMLRPVLVLLHASTVVSWVIAAACPEPQQNT